MRCREVGSKLCNYSRKESFINKLFFLRGWGNAKMIVLTKELPECKRDGRQYAQNIREVAEGLREVGFNAGISLYNEGKRVGGPKYHVIYGTWPIKERKSKVRANETNVCENKSARITTLSQLIREAKQAEKRSNVDFTFVPAPKTFPRRIDRIYLQGGEGKEYLDVILDESGLVTVKIGDGYAHDDQQEDGIHQNVRRLMSVCGFEITSE